MSRPNQPARISASDLNPGDRIAIKGRDGVWYAQTVIAGRYLDHVKDIVFLEPARRLDCPLIVIDYGELPYDPTIGRPATTIEDCIAVRIGEDGDYLIASQEPVTLTSEQVAATKWHEVSAINTQVADDMACEDVTYLLDTAWGE